MFKRSHPGLSLSPSLFQGKSHGHPDNEHEEGLYQIPEPEPIPRMMMELEDQSVEESFLGTVFEECAVEMGSFNNQQEHCDSPEQIQGVEAVIFHDWNVNYQI
jgi:hypothetical protein